VIGPCKITSASERRRVEGCQPHKAGEAVELAALSKLEGRFTVTVLARSPLPLLVREEESSAAILTGKELPLCWQNSVSWRGV